VSFDRSAVYAKVFIISIRIQILKNAQKRTVVTPLAEAAVYTLMGAVTLGNICPGRTASCLNIKRSSFGGLPVLARGIISLICSHCVSLSSYRFTAM